MDFSTPIRTTRRNLGIPQAQLALVTGVPQSNISRIERGDTADPSAEDVMRLAVALKIPVDAFFSSDELARLESGEIAERLRALPQGQLLGPIETLAERIEEAVDRLAARIEALEQGKTPQGAGGFAWRRGR